MTHNPHDWLEVLYIQLVARALQDDAVMRYISNPANFQEIGRILNRAMAEMAELPVPIAQCPKGWVHKNCRCEPVDIGPRVSPS